MKKLYTIVILLFLFTAKSNAQTQFPFYGFELSNYEVGDSLEYENYLSGPDCLAYELFVVESKKLIGINTVTYSLRYIYTGHCLAEAHTDEVVDTITSTITNDTVYNNNNNILNYQLIPPDSIYLTTPLDSSYIRFDTINGLKRLKMQYFAEFGYGSYEAIENIGIVSTGIYTETSNSNDTRTLIYAHLHHYGIYGGYKFILLGIDKINNPIINLSVNDVNGNLFLTTNIKYPSSLTLYIYDLLGRNVISQQVITGNNPINMNNLLKGMYLYKVTNNEIVLGQGKLMNIKD